MAAVRCCDLSPGVSLHTHKAVRLYRLCLCMVYGEVSMRLYPCAKCREQRGPTAPGQRAGHLVEMSCHKFKYPMQRHCITHSSHHTHSHCTPTLQPNCSRLPSTPLQARPGLRLTSTAAGRLTTPGLLQVYSRSTRPCRRRRWTSRAAPRAPAPWSCA